MKTRRTFALNWPYGSIPQPTRHTRLKILAPQRVLDKQPGTALQPDQLAAAALYEVQGITVYESLVNGDQIDRAAVTAPMTIIHPQLFCTVNYEGLEAAVSGGWVGATTIGGSGYMW